MKKIIENEINLYKDFMKSTNRMLATRLMMDILSEYVSISKNDDGEIVYDYSEFENMLKDVKTAIESIAQFPATSLVDKADEDISIAKNQQLECQYSIRNFTWMLEQLEGSEKDA